MHRDYTFITVCKHMHIHHTSVCKHMQSHCSKGKKIIMKRKKKGGRGRSFERAEPGG